MSHIIESGRVFLRPIEPTDAELYQRWRSNAEMAALAGFPHHPMSLAEVEQRIQRMTEKQGDDGYSFLICLLADERPIGEAMLFELDRGNGSAELGIFIGEVDEWGKGYGTDAVNALVSHGFGVLRLERIWLNVWTENERARRAYEKAGFVHEGTLRHDRYERGRFTDGHVMSILRDEWLSRCSPPAR
ncbi:MAG: GNAT family N-acetyltransferase [Chloroflexota bacterium]|nr:GNAT family N-acetyltransferase [Chloroflexota bacterium]